MKWIAILLNVLLILTDLYLFSTHGVPKKDELYFVIMMFATPICSLVALLTKGGEGWIGLYFKRKALEERRKIEELGRER